MGGLFRNSQSFDLEPRGHIDALARHLILTDIEKPVCAGFATHNRARRYRWGQRVEFCEQCIGAGIDEVGLGQQNTIRYRDLLHGLKMCIQRVQPVNGIHRRQYRRKHIRLRYRLLPDDRLQDRRGVRDTRRFNNHSIEPSLTGSRKAPWRIA